MQLRSGCLASDISFLGDTGYSRLKRVGTVETIIYFKYAIVHPHKKWDRLTRASEQFFLIKLFCQKTSKNDVIPLLYKNNINSLEIQVTL